MKAIEETLAQFLRRQPPFKAGPLPMRLLYPTVEDFNGLKEDLNRPNLGLATTRELLVELECRLRMENLHVRAEKMQRMLEQLHPRLLDYRTVDE